MTVDALHALAERISAETGRPVPYPGGAQSTALVMQVLKDPGSAPDMGASRTGWLDPGLNDDQTATRQMKLMREARLSREICTYWNASPWHVGNKSSVDLQAGARWLREAIAACPDLRVVVAMGKEAREVALAAKVGMQQGDPHLILTWHPMQRGRGYFERRVEQVEALQRAAKLAAAGRA